jgi:hypothetical protein
MACRAATFFSALASPDAELSLPDVVEPEPEPELELPQPASIADAASTAAHEAGHLFLTSVIAYASMAERPYVLERTLVVSGTAHRHCAGGERRCERNAFGPWWLVTKTADVQ